MKRLKDLVNQYYADLDKTSVDGLNKFVSKYVSSDFVLHLPGGMECFGSEAEPGTIPGAFALTVTA